MNRITLPSLVLSFAVAVVSVTAMRASSARGQDFVDFRNAIAMSSDAIVSVTHNGDQAADGDAGQMRPRRNGPFQFNQLARFNVDRERAGFAVSGSAILTTLPGSVTNVVATDKHGNSYEGTVIARDNVTGLCVVALAEAQFVSLVLGAEVPQAGLPVVATSLRDGTTVGDAGMVSSDPTAIEPSLGFTPSIDFGDSDQTAGSPVVDSAGVVVGTLVRGPSGAIRCLPASQLTRLVDQALSDSPSDLKRAIVGMQFESNDTTRVVAISPDSPAEAAQLQEGDEIVKVGDYEIRTASEVVAAVAMARAGDKLTVLVKRGDDQVETTVTLKEHPQQAVARWQNQAIPPLGGGAFQLKDGQLVPLELDGKLFDGGNLNWQELLKDPNALGGIAPLITPDLKQFQMEQSDMEGALDDMQKRIEELNDRLKAMDEKENSP